MEQESEEWYPATGAKMWHSKRGYCGEGGNTIDNSAPQGFSALGLAVERADPPPLERSSDVKGRQ